MAFYSLSDLVQRVIVRLRMVAGSGTQLYAEPAIQQYLEETYEMVRARRWWDHLMTWQTITPNGVDGLYTPRVTVPLRDRFRDVQYVCPVNSSTPLPVLSSAMNPNTLTTGGYARFVQPLHEADDADPAGRYYFKVLPVTATNQLAMRIRCDTADVFTDPAVVVPFDATCLVSGAASRYAASSGTNPADVNKLERVFEARLAQLEGQHDEHAVSLDPRFSDPLNNDQWIESWR